MSFLTLVSQIMEYIESLTNLNVEIYGEESIINSSEEIMKNTLRVKYLDTSQIVEPGQTISSTDNSVNFNYMTFKNGLLMYFTNSAPDLPRQMNFGFVLNGQDVSLASLIYVFSYTPQTTYSTSSTSFLIDVDAYDSNGNRTFFHRVTIPNNAWPPYASPLWMDSSFDVAVISKLSVTFRTNNLSRLLIVLIPFKAV